MHMIMNNRMLFDMEFSVISHEDIECTCLTKQEKRRAFLLCCISVDEPCPIHTSNDTDTTLVQSEAEERTESKKLSLYQKIKSLLFRKKYKDLIQELDIEILQEIKDIPQKIQESSSLDSKDTPAEKDIVTENESETTDDDLFAAVLSSMAETETKRRKRQNRKSKEILGKYADYDENRERIL